jgi:hypothetical protein
MFRFRVGLEAFYLLNNHYLDSRSLVIVDLPMAIARKARD